MLGQITILVIVGGLVYFVPSFVAGQRQVNRRGQIYAINTLAGWTLVGWIIAFVMACAPKEER